MLRIGLGIIYSNTLNIKDGSGLNIRNQYIFNNIISRLIIRGYNLSVRVLQKPQIKPDLLNLIGFTATKFLMQYFRGIEPLHFTFYEKVYRKIELKNLDVVFLNHIYDLFLYEKSEKDTIIITEMPDNIIETAGYLSRRKICIKCLKNITVKYLNATDIISVPTMRDALKYRSYGIKSRIIIIPNVIPMPMRISDIIKLSKQKFDNNDINIVIESWVDYRERLSLASKLIRYLPNNVRIHITRGSRDMNIRNRIFIHEYLPRDKWLELLCKSHILIYYPKIPWIGGHSVRLNDAALCGNVIIGSDTDLRGEPYPYQYSYIDIEDLIVKLLYVTNNAAMLTYMGMKNQEEAIRRFRIGQSMLDVLSNIITKSS